MNWCVNGHRTGQTNFSPFSMRVQFALHWFAWSIILLWLWRHSCVNTLLHIYACVYCSDVTVATAIAMFVNTHWQFALLQIVVGQWQACSCLILLIDMYEMNGHEHRARLWTIIDAQTGSKHFRSPFDQLTAQWLRVPLVPFLRPKAHTRAHIHYCIIISDEMTFGCQ